MHIKKGKLEIHAHSRDITIPNIKEKKIASEPGKNGEYDFKSRARDSGTADGNGSYDVK